MTLGHLDEARSGWTQDDLGDPFQPSPGVLVITASKARDLAVCPRRYGLAHVLRLEGDADATEQTEELALGLALHTELRLRHAHPERHDDVALLDPLSPSVPWVSQRVRAHMDLCPSTLIHSAVSYVDGECDLQWFRPRRNVIVRGRIDALWLYDDGLLEVRDYKSGFVPDTLDDDPAALIYGLLALTHPIAASRRRVQRVRVTYEALRSVDSTTVSLNVDGPVITKALRLVQSIDERIRGEKRFHATPSLWACGTCPYRCSCPFSASAQR